MAVASSRISERSNLRVATELLRVSRSFEARPRVKGINPSANPRSRRSQEENTSGVDNANAFPLLASNAKRRVERCLSWQQCRCALSDAQDLRRVGCSRRSFRANPHCRDGRRRRRQQKGCYHSDNTRLDELYSSSFFAPPPKNDIGYGPLGAVHTSDNHDAVVFNVHQKQYGLLELAGLSTNDATFLATKTEASVGHLDLRQLSRNLAYVNDALAVLHLVRHEETKTNFQFAGDVLHDETTAANLEHLLLRVQHSLVEAFIGRLAKVAVASASSWYVEWKQKGKLGGQQWCSEFSSYRRPQSTTWPWTIRPALAVLWGVCWMFYNNDNYSRQRSSAPTEGERHGLGSSQQVHGVPPMVVMSDPDNAQFFNSLGADNGAYLAYGQQALGGIADFNPSSYYADDDGGASSGGGDRDEDIGGGSSFFDGGEAEADEAGGCGGATVARTFRAPVRANSANSPLGIQTTQPPTSSPPTRRRQNDDAQYITSSNASPDTLFSPNQFSAAYAPEAGSSPGDAQPPQALGLSINSSWHPLHDQNFQPFLATNSVSPHAARPGHLIPTIRVIADRSELSNALRRPVSSVTSNKAAAPQAYNQNFNPTTTYATSTAKSESLQDTLSAFDVPHSHQHDASFFQTSQQFFSSPRDLMGLQVATNMYQHDQIRPEPSTPDGPPLKRRRVSNASESLSVASTHMRDEQDRSTSPAASDSISPQGFPLRRGYTFKRNGEPPRNSDGKIICQADPTCKLLTFDRKCEWGKHMDKHERPYRCDRPECSKLQGFTYSGGLLRHQREVHNMHGGTGKRLFCPEASCKRAGGSGFTRKENLNEHMRRVHRRTDSVSEASTNAGGAAKTDDDAEARYSSVERDSPRSRASTAVNDVKRTAIFVKPEKPAEDDYAPDSELHMLRRALTSRDEELAQTKAQLKEQEERLKRLEEMVMKKIESGVE